MNRVIRVFFVAVMSGTLIVGLSGVALASSPQMPSPPGTSRMPVNSTATAPFNGPDWAWVQQYGSGGNGYAVYGDYWAYDVGTFTLSQTVFTERGTFTAYEDPVTGALLARPVHGNFEGTITYGVPGCGPDCMASGTITYTVPGTDWVFIESMPLGVYSQSENEPLP